MLIHLVDVYLHNTFPEGGLLDHKVNAYVVLLDTAKFSYVTAVIVSFIPTSSVPRYVVKHCFGCFCKGVPG